MPNLWFNARDNVNEQVMNFENRNIDPNLHSALAATIEVNRWRLYWHSTKTVVGFKGKNPFCRNFDQKFWEHESTYNLGTVSNSKRPLKRLFIDISAGELLFAFLSCCFDSASSNLPFSVSLSLSGFFQSNKRVASVYVKTNTLTQSLYKGKSQTLPKDMLSSRTLSLILLPPPLSTQQSSEQSS